MWAQELAASQDIRQILMKKFWKILKTLYLGLHHIYLKKNSIKQKDKKRKTYLPSSISLYLT